MEKLKGLFPLRLSCSNIILCDEYLVCLAGNDDQDYLDADKAPMAPHILKKLQQDGYPIAC